MICLRRLKGGNLNFTKFKFLKINLKKLLKSISHEASYYKLAITEQFQVARECIRTESSQKI